MVIIALTNTTTKHFHSSTQLFRPTMALRLRALNPHLPCPPPPALNPCHKYHTIGQTFMGHHLRIDSERTIQLGCKHCGTCWPDGTLRLAHCATHCGLGHERVMFIFRVFAYFGPLTTGMWSPAVPFWHPSATQTAVEAVLSPIQSRLDWSLTRI